jgi:hypothetical protein
VIRNLIPYELGGTVDLAYTASGLRCNIEIPSKEATARDRSPCLCVGSHPLLQQPQ